MSHLLPVNGGFRSQFLLKSSFPEKREPKIRGESRKCILLKTINHLELYYSVMDRSSIITPTNEVKVGV